LKKCLELPKQNHNICYSGECKKNDCGNNKISANYSPNG